MNAIPKIVILLETRRSFDRQLMQGISQYFRLRGRWAFHIECDRLDRLRISPTLWNGSGMIARLCSDRIEKAVNAANIPVIVVDSDWNPSARHTANRTAGVFADSEKQMKLAVEHFLIRGFKRLAFVGAPVREQSDSQQEGFERAIRRIGHSLSVYHCHSSHNRPRPRERSAMANWLEKLPKPIGIVACNDDRAVQVLEACRIARICVPNQVAVIGMGNDELLCELADPPLSSVALDAIHGGYRAAQVLDQLMRKSGRSCRRLVVHPSGVAARSSTDIDASLDPDISAARSFIHRHCSQEVTVDSLAEHVGISRRGLEVKFRKHTGRTVLEEIQDVRLARAKAILRETESPIARVACSSGYSSVSYFIRLFTRSTSLTPATYRRASRVSEEDSSHSPGSWRLAE